MSRNLEIDRFYAEVGRIRCSAKTTSRRERDFRAAVLDWWHQAGRLDVLRDLQAKRVSILQVLEMEMTGEASMRKLERIRDRSGEPSIYAIQNIRTGMVKIGYSTHPERRLRAMQTDNADELELLASIPGSRYDELLVHEKLAAARYGGEWFHPTPEVMEWVQSLIPPEGVSGNASVTLAENEAL